MNIALMGITAHGAFSTLSLIIWLAAMALVLIGFKIYNRFH